MLFIYLYMSHFNIKMLHINLMINVDIFNTYLVITYLACTARYLLLPPRFHTFSRTSYNLTDNMLQFPAAERNKEPMLNVLKEHLPVDQEGQALEIASGSGTHVTLFAQHFPLMSWQPTEIDQKCLQR